MSAPKIKSVKDAETSRLRIPLLNGLDIIHGFRTGFPIPLGLACTWNIPLIEKTARIAAIEATAFGQNWTFSPMVDLTRDPRWGRVMEGSGEDPYLGGEIAAAIVKGYQGDDLTKDDALLACVKHFGMYGAAEAGRDYNTTDMSRINMYEFYLPPYKAAIDAGALSIMSSFNDVDGVPASCNKWLLTDLLRKQWGYKGFVVSDDHSITQIVEHGVAANHQEAAALSLKAGLDMDLNGDSYINTLKKSYNEKRITMADIDLACRRVLEVKYKMGLFKNRYKNWDAEKADKVSMTKENLAVAKQAAMESFVLLKNQNNILPLKKNATIALIGPLADNQSEMLGNWQLTSKADSVTTILKGLRSMNINVTYSKGVVFTEEAFLARNLNIKPDPEASKKMLDEAIAVAQKSDVIVAVLGETRMMSGESTSRTDISLPENQRRLLAELKKTGKPIVWVLMSGRPLTIENDVENADAVIEAWFPGTEAGNAIASVLYGDYNPSGKLTMTFPRSVGQIPIYYNHKNTGRPITDPRNTMFTSRYIDQPNEPLYPFGYGLSYTTFTYSPITLSDTLLRGNKTLVASVRLTNSGKSAGEETVQLYLRDMVASVTRPVKELKGFKKVMLQPGETQVVSFNITPEELKFYNSELKYDWESGDFNVFIGTNSSDVQSAKFRWVK